MYSPLISSYQCPSWAVIYYGLSIFLAVDIDLHHGCVLDPPYRWTHELVISLVIVYVELRLNLDDITSTNYVIGPTFGGYVSLLLIGGNDKYSSSPVDSIQVDFYRTGELLLL